MTDKIINQAFRSWANILRPYVSTVEMDKILSIVLQEERISKTIYPANKDVFRCFKDCDYNNFKVMFVGIEPYLRGESIGLSYAVNPEWTDKTPAAARNILIELQNEYPETILDSSFKTWPEQGILMYNLALTVVDNKTRSHISYWRNFSKFLFKELSERNTGIIYVLLGHEAHEYALLIAKDSNYILKYAHPAAESMTRGNAGFFDSNIFKDINTILLKQYGHEIIF